VIVATALTASAGLFIAGNAKGTCRSLRGGDSRPRQSRISAVSPLFAISIAFLTIVSASSSSSFSIATVTLLRDPAGLPFGLPDCPGSNNAMRLLLQ